LHNAREFKTTQHEKGEIVTHENDKSQYRQGPCYKKAKNSSRQIPSSGPKPLVSFGRSKTNNKGPTKPQDLLTEDVERKEEELPLLWKKKPGTIKEG